MSIFSIWFYSLIYCDDKSSLVPRDAETGAERAVQREVHAEAV